MSWSDLFARGAVVETTEAAIRETLGARRDARREGDQQEEDASPSSEANARQTDEPPASTPTGSGLARVVADADVLAADLLVGGPSRDAMDVVRAHSWVTLGASDALLADAEAVIDALADAELASEWRRTIEALAEVVEHPAGDHPAIAAAYHGGARHVLTLDESLTSAAAGVTVRERVETSVKHPAAFARLFDPAAIYPLVVGGAYPGPDRDSRE